MLQGSQPPQAFVPLHVKLGAQLCRSSCGFTSSADLLQLFETTGIPHQVHKSATPDIGYESRMLAVYF